MTDGATVTSKDSNRHLQRAAAVGRQARSWQKYDFRIFQRGLTQARRDKDKAALEKAFALAADVPIFKEALDWAKANGIEFFVDRTCTKAVGAYYTGGTGVVGVNFRALQNPQLMAIYLTHEIRHAWQDAHGILGHSMKPDYAGEAIRTALVEADAMAFETLAAHQAARATLQKRQAEKGLPSDLAIRLKRIEKMCASEKDDLWRGFNSWFGTQRPFFYGTAVAKREAAVLGMGDVKPADHKYEFVCYGRPDEQRLIDITRDADFQKLGATFGGGNYLNQQKRREFVLRTVNNPGLARSFWRAGTKPSKLILQLRKKELEMKSDAPQLELTALGNPEDLAALGKRLAQLLDGTPGLASVDVPRQPTAKVLQLVVTFKKGADPVSAFGTVARRIDGRWADAAPSVYRLELDGLSRVLRGARGILGRTAYKPRGTVSKSVISAATP